MNFCTRIILIYSAAVTASAVGTVIYEPGLYLESIAGQPISFRRTVGIALYLASLALCLSGAVMVSKNRAWLISIYHKWQLFIGICALAATFTMSSGAVFFIGTILGGGISRICGESCVSVAPNKALNSQPSAAGTPKSGAL